VGFDASEVMRELDTQRVLREVDAQRVLRDSSPIASVSNSLLQYKNIARELSGVDRMHRSFGGIDQMIRDIRGTDRMLSMARVAGRASFAEMNRAGLYADLAKHVVPEFARRGLPGLARNLASLNDYSRMQSDVLKPARMLGALSLSGSIAQAFEAHGLDSARSAAWTLRRLRSLHTSPLRPVLKAAPTFGPIVVSPDYEEDEPFHYDPDLQGWLIPETATQSGDAMNIEELIAEAYAYAVGIAQHHHTRALLTIVGKHGSAFMIRVAENVVGGLIVYWLLSR
jgi:hypothetical protein